MTETQPEVLAESESAKPTETVEFWRAKAREQERRAKENKTAADKLAELEEAQKSEAQKHAEKLAEADRRLADAIYREAVADVAATHGLPIAIAHGPKERTAEAATEYAAALMEWIEGRKAQGNYVPSEGKQPPSSANSEMREFARALFGTS